MINILLIDDSPESLFKSPGNEEIPILDTDEGVFYDELKHYFNLRWLQSPEDIKDFRDFSNIIDDFHGHTVLGKEGFIPEIIVFDYYLGKGMNDTIQLDNDDDLKNVIPNFEIAKKLNAKISRTRPEYLIRDFNQEIEKNKEDYPDNNRLNNNSAIDDILKSRNTQRPALRTETTDTLGCYAGGLIALQYKDHPCIGIPTTSRSEDDIAGSEATIFEWWLDYDFNGLFSLKHRTNPQWQELIPKAVFNLRERIKQLVQGGKVIPPLLELFQIASCIIPSERTFNFTSKYGTKELPLDGLFIDKKSELMNPIPEEIKKVLEMAKDDGKIAEIEITERDYEVWKFVIELLEIIAKTTNVKLEEIKNAIAKYDNRKGSGIYATYKQRFLDRILLSDFSQRQLTNSLSNNYTTVFASLKKSFGISDRNNTIHPDFLCSIEIAFRDRKSKHKNNGTDLIELRLLILLLSTRLWIDHFNSNGGNSNNPLVKEDYYYVLNPIVNTKKGNNPLALLMHTDGISESDYTDSFGKWLFDFSNHTIPRSDWQNFNWIEPGEKRILESFFQPELSILNDKPVWLK